MQSIDRTDPAGSIRWRHQTRRSLRLPDIDTHRCTGCGRCVAACELHLLSLEVVHWEKFSVLHEAARCTGCRRCVERCPFDAIAMRAQGFVASFPG